MPQKKGRPKRKLFPRVRMTEEEAENKIEQMLKDGYTFPEIAQELHMSVTTIHKVNDKIKKTRESKEKSTFSKSYILLKKNTPLIDVAIQTDTDAQEAKKNLQGYLELTYMDELLKIYQDLGQDLHHFLDFYKEFKTLGIDVDQAPRLMELASQRNQLFNERLFLTHEVSKLTQTRTVLSIQVQELIIKSIS